MAVTPKDCKYSRCRENGLLLSANQRIVDICKKIASKQAAMKIIVQTPDFKPSPSLKDFIISKVSKLEKYHQAIISAEVTVEKDKTRVKDVIKCSIILGIPGKDEFVKASSSIFEDAILKAVENAKRRLSIRKTQLLVARKKRLKEKTK